MTKEEKELLINDLSARLQYGVKCHINHGTEPLELVGVILEDDGKWYTKFGLTEMDIDHWNPKPYLKPMSSLTKEQIDEINRYAWYAERHEYDEMEDLQGKQMGWAQCFLRELNWYHKNHYDCNGLINKGLALPAEEGMYED